MSEDVCLHQPVVLWFTVKNESDAPLQADLGGTDFVTRDPALRLVLDEWLSFSMVGLAAGLTEAARFDENRDAEVAELAWIRDPVAVPYLEAAIAAEVSPAFFETLVAIATPEARMAVARLVEHPQGWVSKNATSSLARFK